MIEELSEDPTQFETDLQTLETHWAEISKGVTDEDRAKILEGLQETLLSSKARNMCSLLLLRSIPSYWGPRDDGQPSSAAELLSTGQLWPQARPYINIE